MAEKKQKKTKPAPVVQTRWIVSGIKGAPPGTVIAGRKINDRQIIYLPVEQKYIDGLEKAGYEVNKRSS